MPPQQSDCSGTIYLNTYTDMLKCKRDTNKDLLHLKDY